MIYRDTPTTLIELRNLLSSLDEISHIEFSDDELETTLLMAAEDIDMFTKDYNVPAYYLYSGMFREPLVFIAGFYAATRRALQDVSKTKGSEEYLDNLTSLEAALKTFVEMTLGSCLNDLGIEIPSDDGSFEGMIVYSEPDEEIEENTDRAKDYIVFDRKSEW